MQFAKVSYGRVALLLVLFFVNVLIVYKYSNASSWVLFNGPKEALTGSDYSWPKSVTVVSYLLLVICSSLLLGSIGVLFRRRVSKHIIVFSVFVLGCVEFLDSASLHARYGTDFYDPSQYVYGPLLFIWAFFSWKILAKTGEDRENNEDLDTQKYED